MGHIYQGVLPGVPVGNKKQRGFSRDVMHLYMTKGVTFDPLYEMPIMKLENKVPEKVISFSEAMRKKNIDSTAYVSFHENDDQIERFWNNPWAYLSKLSKYAGFIATDFSTGPSICDPVRRHNVYRNQLTGAWLQSLGYHVLCNVRCPSYGCDYFLSGVPRKSLVAVGTIGCVKNIFDRNRFEGGLIRLVNEVHPLGIVVVGTDSYGVFDYARECGIPLYFFDGQTERYFGGEVHV